MSTIRYRQNTTSTPEQFVAGLTGIGPGRSKLFPNGAGAELKVHRVGPHDAHVTGGGVFIVQGKNVKGCGLSGVLGTVGKGVLRNAFRKVVKAIEVRGGNTAPWI
jgi:hypothetical protein